MSSDPKTAQIYASVAAGCESAAETIFHRYLQRLTKLARSRLTPKIAQRVDSEDIVMSAYRSFFVGARADRFRISESGQLWALLTKITLRKIYRAAEFHSADKRSTEVETHFSDDRSVNAWAVDREPSPEEVVAISDELSVLLGSLATRQRRIVELRLQGHFVQDIATELNISERTVRRALQEIERNLCDRHGVNPVRFDRGTTTEAAKNSVTESHPVDTDSLFESQEERHRRLAQFDVTFEFSQFTLRKMIGSGGIGKVYAATLKTDGSTVAVKFLHRDFQKDPAAVERFLEEAAIIQELNHPGIVNLKGIGQTPAGVYFLVMPFISGLPADKSGRDNDWKTIVKWGIAMADALGHAHSVGVVHCDLKPSNVMIQPNGEPILLDFGLAQSITAKDFHSTSLAGTAPWMAPEQIDEHFGNISPQTDIYGLGALLYTLLCNRPPHLGRHPADVLGRVISNCEIAPAMTIRDELPNDLSLIIDSCLQRNANDRPATAAILGDLLQNVVFKD